MEQFAAELRAFDDKKTVVNELRKELRKPLPPFRKTLRAFILSHLPPAGGLNAWVARASLTVRFKDAGRRIGISLKLSRKSGKEKADLNALNSTGKVRHPLFGNRRHWYGQSVDPGFFDIPWEDAAEDYYDASVRAVDQAFDKIRRG